MRFEDLQAWQWARELTNAVYSLCRQKPLASNFGLRDQIQRAAVSSMNNLAPRDSVRSLQNLASETGTLIYGLMRSTKPPES